MVLVNTVAIKSDGSRLPKSEVIRLKDSALLTSVSASRASRS